MGLHCSKADLRWRLGEKGLQKWRWHRNLRSTLEKARRPHHGHPGHKFTHLPGIGVILSWTGGHHPPALVGISYWNNLFFISLGDGSTWACLCSVDAASLSFTDVFPCNAFLLCPCLDTFCLCYSSYRVKKLRVGFDYLITMVTRMTLMPICTQ